MPTVTDIKPQKRSSERFSVYVDGCYAFALGDLALSASGLRVGREVSADDIERYAAEALEGKAYEAALRQLALRRRSRRELADYFRRKDYATETAEAVLSRLERAGLIDDEAFARAWVADRQLLRPRSRRALAAELAAKGIARETAAMAVGEVGAEDELTTLMRLAERKYRQARYQDTDKLAAYLARQGYSYDQIKQALARLEGLVGGDEPVS